MRSVSWKNWDEWVNVYHLLYNNDENEILKGCAKVSAWLSKQQVPIAIEVTAALQKELHNHKRNVDALSLAIIRFINGVVEPFKDSNLSASIQLICNEHNIPDHVLNIRHAATHGQMPTFDFACVGALSALNWLQENYWEQQIKVLEIMKNDARNDVISFFNHQRNDPFKGMKKFNVLTFILPEIISFLVDHSRDYENYANLLIELIQNKKEQYPDIGYAISAALLTELRKGKDYLEDLFNYFNSNFPVEQELIDWHPQQPNEDILQWPKASVGNLPIQISDDLSLDPSEVDFVDDPIE